MGSLLKSHKTAVCPKFTRIRNSILDVKIAITLYLGSRLQPLKDVVPGKRTITTLCAHEAQHDLCAMLQAKAAHKAAFEAAVRAEIARIMAVGKNTANEAAALAVAAARHSLSQQM